LGVNKRLELTMTFSASFTASFKVKRFWIIRNVEFHRVATSCVSLHFASVQRALSLTVAGLLWWK
jgi:hypothetical protein